MGPAVSGCPILFLLRGFGWMIGWLGCVNARCRGYMIGCDALMLGSADI